MLDRLADSPHVVRMMRAFGPIDDARFDIPQGGQAAGAPVRFCPIVERFQPEFWPGHEGMDVWNAEKVKKILALLLEPFF